MIVFLIKRILKKSLELEYEYKYKQQLDSLSIRELKLTKIVLIRHKT
jgi:hypothetical protein